MNRRRKYKQSWWRKELKSEDEYKARRQKAFSNWSKVEGVAKRHSEYCPGYVFSKEQIDEHLKKINDEYEKFWKLKCKYWKMKQGGLGNFEHHRSY